MNDLARAIVFLKTRSVRAALCLGAASVLPSIASAQTVPTVSQPVVQALPSRNSQDLNSALGKLARDPRNVDALIDAGNAAIGLGDFEAAIGFFKRGQQLSPQNSRLLAGLAGALAHSGDPVSAIRLFSQAEAAGADSASIAADRGLAYDLAGDPASAQRYYHMALPRGGEQVDEVRRRLAISHAISGDGPNSEKVLNPLLHKQDKAAWRSRAFALAILGNSKEATNITRTLLPARLADSIAPYMQYMPRLTPAQQAAAANLGVFPRASDIGRDGTAIASFSASGDGASMAAVDRTLVPAGQPLGASSGAKLTRAEMRAQQATAKREARRAKQVARVEPPVPQPGRQVAQANPSGFAAATPASVPPVSGIMAGRQPKASAAPKSTAVRPNVAASGSRGLGPGFVAPTLPASPAPAPSLGPGFAVGATPAPVPPPTRVSVAAPVASPAPVSEPVRAAAPAPAAPALASAAPFVLPPAAGQPSFIELFRDLDRPTGAVAPAVGAVDIRKIEPARPAPKAPPPPKALPPPKVAPKPPPPPPPPSHPSRIWVQVAVGQKLPALAFDWRRMQRSNPVLAKQKPHTAKLNQTNRLVVGPFGSQKEASAFIADLRKAGMDGPYIWTSPAGEVVDSLAY